MKDYEYVWTLLEEDYPYYAYIVKQGVEVKDIKERYEREVLDVDSDESFAELLSSMFIEMGGLGHLSVVDMDTYNAYCSLIEKDRSFGSIKMDIAFKRRLNSENLSKIYSIQNKNSYYKKEININNETQTQYLSENNTLYIKIPTFSSDLIERDKDLLQNVIINYPETKNIIIDISGNGGGSDMYWIENIIEPFGGDYIQNSTLYFKNSYLVDEYFGEDILNDISSLEYVPEYVSDFGLDKYIDNNLCISGDSKISNCKDIKKWVIISENTYSSADSFAQFCKETGWAVLVGTKTGGSGGGVTPILEILPNTGILIRFSLDIVINDDGEVNAIVGTYPDRYCKKNETPLDKCIEEIKKDSAERE